MCDNNTINQDIFVGQIEFLAILFRGAIMLLQASEYIQPGTTSNHAWERRIPSSRGSNTEREREWIGMQDVQIPRF